LPFAAYLKVRVSVAASPPVKMQLQEETMYCNYCGKLLQDDANHCAYCGKRIGGVIARKRLVRPRAERKIAGVCAGCAEYFDLDVTLVRLVWLIAAVLTGVGLLSYPIAWIVMPEEPEPREVPAGHPATNV
jgi:phage shock protein C